MRTFAKVFSAELEGIDARLIEVETDLHPGVHAFTIVGLADKALSESKERINAALKNSGTKSPNHDNRRVVVNLAPADIKKTGSHYDLAIAVSYLTASNQIVLKEPGSYLLIGELALDGALRPVAGAMNMARLAVTAGIPRLIISSENAAEAAMIDGVEVFGARTLKDVIDHVEGNVCLLKKEKTLPGLVKHAPFVSIEDIRGQENAKRALIISAAGGHNLLMVGPPGTGKTMLAQALVSILPPPDLEEIIEMTQIYSAANMLDGAAYVGHRPFRCPHQTASTVAIFGGGQSPRPGEISLAHRGVLFLDEMPEFRRDLLESLRQPLESGKAIVSRVKGNVVFPAQFTLVAAMNPCPCGHSGDSSKTCVCSPYEILRYGRKISGPLLDRIDIQITVPRIRLDELRSVSVSSSHTEITERITKARLIQKARGARTNSELSSKQITRLAELTPDADELMRSLFERSLVSARGYYRVLRVARTIADLEGAQLVHKSHLLEAFSYRVRTKDDQRGVGPEKK